MYYGQARVPTEFALLATREYADIFNEVEVDVIFTSAEGREWRVPTFWAGGNAFRVRFAVPDPGRYAWRSVCTNEADPGLHGQQGELEVAHYAGGNSLLAHGRLRVADTKRTLEHEDGTPFLWLGDTWWMGLTKRLDWPEGFRALALDRVQKGFSGIQIVCGPLPDFCPTIHTWHPQQANEAGWPWEPEYARINPAFYDLADLRIAYLAEVGLVPCIVSMWGFYLPFMGVAKVKQHWRNLIARYGAYPVVWCLCGEADLAAYLLHSEPEKVRQLQAEQLAGWTEAGRYVRGLDPYHNPITIHPGYGVGREQVADVSVLDLEMLQSGHGGHHALEGCVRMTAGQLLAEPRMPVYNAEASYEGIQGGSWQETQRFLFWACMTLGTCGHTYGAQGIWGMSSRHEPFKGTTESWGDGFWQEAMHYPGSAQVGIGRKLLLRYPWWRFEPLSEPALPSHREQAFAAGIPGAVRLYYFAALCIEDRFQGLRSCPLYVGTEANYRAYYFNPRTAQERDLGVVTPDAEGRWTPPPCPTMEDWVLVLEDKDALARL